MLIIINMGIYNSKGEEHTLPDRVPIYISDEELPPTIIAERNAECANMKKQHIKSSLPERRPIIFEN